MNYNLFHNTSCMGDAYSFWASFKSLKGVRAHKIPRFSFSIEERGVLGEYVEVAVTRNIQFYVSTAIHHSRSIFRKERKVICICGHQR